MRLTMTLLFLLSLSLFLSCLHFSLIATGASAARQVHPKKRVANGAAPAVSGFTGDHGLPLLDDVHCLRELSRGPWLTRQKWLQAQRPYSRSGVIRTNGSIRVV